MSNDIALDGNEIWNNALDGVRLDADLTDLALVANRIRNNGRRAEPATSGGGHTVSYTAMSLVDTAADWLEDGHLGKWVTVGGRHAIVIGNSANELRLAPLRPGAMTAWTDDTPPVGTRYSLPNPPNVRAGMAIGANVVSPTIRDNRVWDNQRRKTQTHGLWITGSGVCESGWVEDNNFQGNAIEAARFDGEPCGYWDHNHGLEGLP
jgi:hypothetical protein